MIYSLSVSNYILIDSLDTQFPEGLSILSGETGAGKSILLGALSLVLGAKADAGMVGPGGENCIVEAEFGVTPEVKAILEKADLPSDGDRLILRRSVGKSGRSRSFANDEPVTLPVLQELSSHLVDIHSQHETLLLTQERFRMEALDLWAGAVELRESTGRIWADILEKERSLKALEEKLSRARAEEDYNSARWERLKEARLNDGEMEELEEEEKRLAHAEEIKLALCQAESILSPDGDGNDSPSRLLVEAARQVEKASAFIPSLEELAGRLKSARIEIEDVAAEVSLVNSRTEASPERLAEVRERLSLLYSLLQKHGVKTVAELIAERDRLETLVTKAGSLSEECDALRKEIALSREKHTALCRQLHEKRAAAAKPFSAAVEEVLHGLELERASFAVKLEPAPAGATGTDSVGFLFSAASRTPEDIGKAASGGELSRVMLSIKAVMASLTKMPTMVFDEIDSGVSGSAADKMGSLVCRMGENMQVFAITHLPQVAAKGHAHFLVSKSNDVTSMERLDREGRVRELARMLSGSEITPEALANARSLLNA